MLGASCREAVGAVIERENDGWMLICVLLPSCRSRFAVKDSLNSLVAGGSMALSSAIVRGEVQCLKLSRS